MCGRGGRLQQELGWEPGLCPSRGEAAALRGVEAGWVHSSCSSARASGAVRGRGRAVHRCSW